MSNKIEKLKNQSAISLLFKESNHFFYRSIRISYLFEEGEPGIFYFISVPKKKYKKAVDRNKIRRQIREILVHKVDFSSLQNRRVNLCIAFTDKNQLNFNDLSVVLKETFRIFNKNQQVNE